MTVSIDSFLLDYPEFDNQNVLPSQITYWLAVAGMLLNQSRWGAPAPTDDSPPTSMYDVGVELFVAHNVTLEWRALAEGNRGALPGLTQGPVAAKSIGPASVNYAVEHSVEIDAGHWNETIYGRRFIQLVYMFGAGPLQVGPRAIGDLMTLVPQGIPWWGAIIDLGWGWD